LTFDASSSWLDQPDFDMGFKTFVTPSCQPRITSASMGWRDFGFKKQGACINVVNFARG
jgi:hypothetical protein